ncbi:MAG: RNA-binding protein [Planctomycetes bacterium]|nr:RNA-binding protein [Planctomycetota bacterium]
MNIYVGNLPFSATDAELRAAFEPFGEVTSAQVIQDRETGRSRGFGFVEMPSADQARAAIAALDGSDMGGRSLKVNEARPKTDRREGGGGGGGYRGGSGGGGGYRGGSGGGGARRPTW